MIKSANCCCHWGAAVRGEWPEFECQGCTIHRLFGDWACRRHR